MQISKLVLAAAALVSAQACLSAEPAPATPKRPDPDLVVLENGKEQVTALDFQAAMTRFPDELRAEASAYPAVIMKNIDAIFVNRVAADRAREAGLDKDVVTRRRMQQLQEAYLAQKYLDYVAQNAKVPDLSLRAEEVYKSDPKKFMDPAWVTVQHLVVSLWGRTPEMARKRAEEALAKLKAGADWATVASEYSDDPGVKRHKGDLGQVQEASLEPELRDALAKMKTGETSAPIDTRTGVHLVHLRDRKPPRQKTFAEVKEGLIAAEEDTVRKRATEDFLTQVRNSPSNTIYKDRVEALRTEIDTSKIDKAHREAIEKLHAQQ